MSRPAGEPGMDADRRVDIRIGHSHDCGGGRPSREAGDIDAAPVDRVAAHDLAGNAGDQRGLALAALLVARAKPVPALGGIGGRRLGGISNQAGVLFAERIHTGAGREVVGRLGAAMQHDDQRQRLSAIAARYVELVGAGAGLVAVGLGQPLRVLRNDVERRRPRLLRPRPQPRPRAGQAASNGGGGVAHGGGARRLASKRAEQQGRRIGEPASAGEADRLDACHGSTTRSRRGLSVLEPGRACSRGDPGRLLVECFRRAAAGRACYRARSANAALTGELA